MTYTLTFNDEAGPITAISARSVDDADVVNGVVVRDIVFSPFGVAPPRASTAQVIGTIRTGGDAGAGGGERQIFSSSQPEPVISTHSIVGATLASGDDEVSFTLPSPITIGSEWVTIPAGVLTFAES